jgi:hypothetical protein
MGYNKLQRKLSAFSYSKKSMNQMVLRTYNHLKDVEEILSGKGTKKFTVQNKQK